MGNGAQLISPGSLIMPRSIEGAWVSNGPEGLYDPFLVNPGEVCLCVSCMPDNLMLVMVNRPEGIAFVYTYSESWMEA